MYKRDYEYGTPVPLLFFLEPLAPFPFPSQAVELLRHALKEYEGSLGNDHPQTLNCAGQPRGLGDSPWENHGETQDLMVRTC